MTDFSRRRTAVVPTPSEQHRQWLELVDIEGPFLALPPLRRVWPNGIPDFRRVQSDRFKKLVEAFKHFSVAWESLDRNPDDDLTIEKYGSSRNQWIEIVLREVVGWDVSLKWGDLPVKEIQSPNRGVTVNAQAALIGDVSIGALVLVVDPTESLRDTPSDSWAANPIDRLEALLRMNNVEIGIVTDGRWWGLVSASKDTMPASGIFDALTWIEEPRTRDAFLTIIGRQYLIGGDPTDRLPSLFLESVTAAEDITEALGSQVRSAVELLIQSFSESVFDARRRGQSSPLPNQPHDVYEAAVTIMMRIVFLLFSEERGLLPAGELFEQGYGISQELNRLAALEIEEGEEALDSTSMSWHRLLATSRALFEGASFENLRMPAYGGSLFDPARFAFLTDSVDNGSLAVTVSDRVMLHVLQSVQIAVIKGEARRITFRDIDVEQIGYIYEGLLGYTCTSVQENYVGLIGALGVEPEIPLIVLEDIATRHSDPKLIASALREWIANDQPSAKAPSVSAIAKVLNGDIEPSRVSALVQIVGDDQILIDRIRPWLTLIRSDLRGYPLVILKGGLMVKETPSRKNSGAHYTPKSLADEVVLYALQPLCYFPGPYQTDDETDWKLRSSDELLGLKVADIACGSGAFLVSAARYLAERVVEAWGIEQTIGLLSGDLYTKAIRQVTANCLYGADINDMAVEMCKLSLWLVSLDRDLPFSFVDDKIFVGNSLLGLTSLAQLRNLHVDPLDKSIDVKFELFDIDLDTIIQKAMSLRERLATEIDDSDPARTSAAKHRQMNELSDVMASLQKIADGVIAVGLSQGGKPGTPLNEALATLREAVKQAYPPQGNNGDESWLDGIIARELTPSVETDYTRWQPLHWALSVPDVLINHGGFDAIIGNPPFLGGQKLTGAMGTEIRDWFVNVLAKGRRGSADLVAYFFLRAFELLNKNGVLGLIATNTIAQGDTRVVGLDQVLEKGFTITRSIRSRSWPAASANLEFAAVWGTISEVGEDAERICDDTPVSHISNLLEPSSRVTGDPIRLLANKSKLFQGQIVLGDGFILESEQEMLNLVSGDSVSSDVVFPYMNGNDLNNRPDCSASRWVIDFNDLPEDLARNYPSAFSRVEALVKPERQERRPNGDFRHRAPRRTKWWQYAEKSPGLRAAIKDLEEVLVIALTSKNVMFMRVPTGQIFSHALAVFAADSYTVQAVLSSTFHQIWAVTYGSTLGTGVRYTPSDVFETFPIPEPTESLEKIGIVLDYERREIMLRRQLGLTALYNLINDPELPGSSDPDVARLREIHVELDQVVSNAFGWNDLNLKHGFHDYRKMERWTVSPAARVEILDRLLEENHRRASEEQADSMATGKVRAKKKENNMEQLF